MKSLIFITAFALLASNMASGSVKGQQVNKKDSLVDIYSSMTGIVDLLEKVSKSISPEIPNTCNKSIGDLQNAKTDWNPDAIYAHGDEVIVKCAKGFMTEQRAIVQTVKCHLGNEWSIFKPCSENRVCTKPIRNIENAEHDWAPGVLYAVDDTFTIKCKEGYRLKSKETEQTVTCLPDDKWSTYEPCIQVCPAPFVRHKGICMYTDRNNDHSWYDSKDKCEAMNPDYGSTLPVVKTAQEQEDLVSYYQTVETGSYSVWIGIHDLDEEGTYIWLDKSPLELHYSGFKWDSGQPNNYDGNQDCTVLINRSSEVELSDFQCSDQYYLSCQIPI